MIKTTSIKPGEALKQYDIVIENTANSAGAAYQVIVPFDSKLRKIVASGTAAFVSSVVDILSVTDSSTLHSAVAVGAGAAAGSIVVAPLNTETIVKAGSIISYSVSATAAVAQKVSLILEKV